MLFVNDLIINHKLIKPTFPGYDLKNLKSPWNAKGSRGFFLFPLDR